MTSGIFCTGARIEGASARIYPAGPAIASAGAAIVVAGPAIVIAHAAHVSAHAAHVSAPAAHVSAPAAHVPAPAAHVPAPAARVPAPAARVPAHAAIVPAHAVFFAMQPARRSAGSVFVPTRPVIFPTRPVIFPTRPDISPAHSVFSPQHAVRLATPSVFFPAGRYLGDGSRNSECSWPTEPSGSARSRGARRESNAPRVMGYINRSDRPAASTDRLGSRLEQPGYFLNCAKISFACCRVSLLPTSNHVPGTLHVNTFVRG
jgi:hypothetical protein